MTEQEQQQALADAGFANVHVELAMNGLMLYASEKAAGQAAALDRGRGKIRGIRNICERPPQVSRDVRPNTLNGIT